MRTAWQNRLPGPSDGPEGPPSRHVPGTERAFRSPPTRIRPVTTAAIGLSFLRKIFRAVAPFIFTHATASPSPSSSATRPSTITKRIDSIRAEVKLGGRHQAGPGAVQAAGDVRRQCAQVALRCGGRCGGGKCVHGRFGGPGDPRGRLRRSLRPGPAIPQDVRGLFGPAVTCEDPL